MKIFQIPNRVGGSDKSAKFVRIELTAVKKLKINEKYC